MPRARSSSVGSLDRSQLATIDLLAVQFEDAWKRKEAPRIEDFLDRPELDAGLRDALFEELLALELEYRVGLGEDPTLAQYVARFPDHAELAEFVFEYVCPSLLSEASARTRSSRGSGSVANDSKGEPISSADSRDPSPLPTHLGRYEILRLIEEGGFGRVLLAQDAELNRLVAIKVSRAGLFAGERDVDRFLKEARMAAQLKHPNIVSIHDVGRDGKLGCYIVMDFIDGGPLDVEEAASRLHYGEVALLIAQIADAVHYAHTRGLVHRDLKPGNVLIDGRGTPFVADFGLAVHESVQEDYEGEVSGTPPYMSPEQVRGLTHRMDGRTDIWSLGILLYELLTGRRPFAGRDRAKVFDEILNRDPKPPRQINDAIPAEMEQVCLKALAKQPAGRYSTALDMADDLRHALARSADAHLLRPPEPPPVQTPERPPAVRRPTVRPLAARRPAARFTWDWRVIGSAAAGLMLLGAALVFWPYLFPSPSDPPEPDDPVVAAPGEPNIEPKVRSKTVDQLAKPPAPPVFQPRATLSAIHPTPCMLISMSSRAQRIASAAEGRVCLSSMELGPLLHEFSYGRTVTSIRLSRDGELLAVLCDGDEQVHLQATREPYATLPSPIPVHQDARLLSARAKDTIWLAQQSGDMLELHDVQTGKVEDQPPIPGWPYAQVAVSQQTVHVAGWNPGSHNWSLISARPFVEVLPDMSPVCSLDVTRDGSHLAIGEYGVAGITSMIVGNQFTQWDGDQGHEATYREVAFSEDGQQLFVCSWREPTAAAADEDDWCGVVVAFDVQDWPRPKAQLPIDVSVTAVSLDPPFVALATEGNLQVFELVPAEPAAASSSP